MLLQFINKYINTSFFRTFTFEPKILITEMQKNILVVLL